MDQSNGYSDQIWQVTVWHLLEFAGIVRGEMENPYSYEHELLVQSCHFQACGYRG